MKKFLVPSLVALFAIGLGQQEANAGVSFKISIGGHEHRPVPVPVVVAPAPCPPPVIVYRPPVVVYSKPARCDYGHAHAYVKSCEHHHRPGKGHVGNSHRRDRHDDRRGHRH